MDADRFETLLREWSSARSRRQALGLAASSALGGLFALRAVPTDAKKKKKKKDKDKKEKECLKVSRGCIVAYNDYCTAKYASNNVLFIACSDKYLDCCDLYRQCKYSEAEACEAAVGY